MIFDITQADGSRNARCDACGGRGLISAGDAAPPGWSWTELRGAVLQALFCPACSKDDQRRGMQLLREKTEACERCGGRGYQDGVLSTNTHRCGSCDGSGKRRKAA